MDILDELQDIDDCVKVFLKSGKALIGYADCIVYDEDSDGYDTIKLIRFMPNEQKYAVYFGEEDVESYEVIKV